MGSARDEIGSAGGVGSAGKQRAAGGVIGARGALTPSRVIRSTRTPPSSAGLLQLHAGPESGARGGANGGSGQDPADDIIDETVPADTSDAFSQRRRVSRADSDCTTPTPADTPRTPPRGRAVRATQPNSDRAADNVTPPPPPPSSSRPFDPMTSTQRTPPPAPDRPTAQRPAPVVTTSHPPAAAAASESGVSSPSDTSTAMLSTPSNASGVAVSAGTGSSGVGAAPSTPANIIAPTVIFGKRELIGAGSFGNVYKVLDADSNRLLAVKEIILTATEGAHFDKQMSSLEREIRVMQMLRHPNIVTYLGATRVDSHFQIYMEYVPGGSMSNLLKTFGPLRPQQAARFIKQVVEGLHYLHGKQIVHRDLKGDNLFIAIDGTVKVGDFGTSKELRTLRFSNSVAGTPHFMAPEVVTNHGHGVEADIWSLGCCLIQMLTGKPPFHSFDNQYAIMFQVSKGDISGQIPTDCPEDAADFIRRCCKLRPQDRPTTTQLLHHPFLRDVASPAASREAPLSAAPNSGAAPAAAANGTGSSGLPATLPPVAGLGPHPGRSGALPPAGGPKPSTGASTPMKRTPPQPDPAAVRTSVSSGALPKAGTPMKDRGGAKPTPLARTPSGRGVA